MTPDQAFSLFGIHPPSLLALARSPEHAQEIWKGIKDTVKRSFRSKAKALHPDVVGGDHEKMAELEERIKELTLITYVPEDEPTVTVLHPNGGDEDGPQV